MFSYMIRSDAVKMRLKKNEAFLASKIQNVKYLTGFTGSNGFALITREECSFITDFRYEEQASEEVDGAFRIVMMKKDLVETLKSLLMKASVKRLCIESTVSYDMYRRLSAFHLRALDGCVEKIRVIKEKEEIGLIEEAVMRAEAAFLDVRPYIKAGVKERTIALRLEEKLKKKGCRRIPFDIIVASGANSSKPHAVASEKRIAPGDLVIVDWGGEAGGYFSDMTRTLLMKGKDIGRKMQIYGLVRQANISAIKAASAGRLAGQVDKAARDVIKKGGYEKHFGHGLGHGVGMEVHELPHIRKTGKERIERGMVFTIEPGVYLPGLGGVRIEDMVAVESKGARLLTSLPTDMAAAVSGGLD